MSMKTKINKMLIREVVIAKLEKNVECEGGRIYVNGNNTACEH
jgi:hypothetical protein